MTDEEFGALIAEKDIPFHVQLQLIQKRTERGLKPKQIAQLMDIDAKHIERIVDKHGWTTKREIIDESSNGRPPKPAEKTEARIRELRRLAKEGYSRKDIAALLGIDRGYVDTLCRRYNIKTASQLERVEKLYAKGWSQIKIAEDVGVSKQRVNQLIQRNALEKGDKS